MAKASGLELFALSLPSANLTTVKVTAVRGDSIVGTYNTLPGNQPNTYGNALFLWQSNNQIPYNTTPLATFKIPGDEQDGSFVFPNLQIQLKSYILGYSVGPYIQQICSTAYIPASGTDFPTFQTNLDVTNISSDSAIVNYQTPDGYQPQTNENWIGLWKGSVAQYTVNPDLKIIISDNPSTGSAVINNFPFQRGETYTLAYFMGLKQTMMAAVYTFST